MPTHDPAESRREVARQLRITNAAFPSMRLTEEAVIAYTEALDMYPADTIAEAFRVARMDSDRNQTHHPRPGEIRKYAAQYSKQRQKPRDADANAPYCTRCESRTLYDDGTPFGRFAIAHASSCAAFDTLPPNARFWTQGSTPASFNAQQPEVVAKLNTISRGKGWQKAAPQQEPSAPEEAAVDLDPELFEVADA